MSRDTKEPVKFDSSEVISKKDVKRLASLYDLQDVSKDDTEAFVLPTDRSRTLHLHFSGTAKNSGTRNDCLLMKDIKSGAVYEYPHINIDQLEKSKAWGGR